MANGTDHNPLSLDDLQKLNQVLVMAGETSRLIDKLKQAGFDTAQAEAENTNHINLATSLKAAFFPGVP